MKFGHLAVRKEIRDLTPEERELVGSCLKVLNGALDNCVELVRYIPNQRSTDANKRENDYNEIRDNVRKAQSHIRRVQNGFTILGSIAGLFGGAVFGAKIGVCIGIGPWGAAVGAAIGGITGLIAGGLVGSTLASLLILIIEKVRAIGIRIESMYTRVDVAATCG